MKFVSSKREQRNLHAAQKYATIFENCISAHMAHAWAVLIAAKNTKTLSDFPVCINKYLKNKIKNKKNYFYI